MVEESKLTLSVTVSFLGRESTLFNPDTHQGAFFRGESSERRRPWVAFQEDTQS